jgi:hypothetical protein
VSLVDETKQAPVMITEACSSPIPSRAWRYLARGSDERRGRNALP